MIVIEVLVLSPVVAPRYVSRVETLEKLLKEKYGEKLAVHIDRVFFRVWCPLHRSWEPALLGSAVKGCLNEYYEPAKRMNFKVHGLFFPESGVICEIRKLESKDSLLIFECAAPMTQGHIVLEPPYTLTLSNGKKKQLSEKEFAKALEEVFRAKREAIIGGWRNRGYGKIRFEHVKIFEKPLNSEVQ